MTDNSMLPANFQVGQCVCMRPATCRRLSCQYSSPSSLPSLYPPFQSPSPRLLHCATHCAGTASSTSPGICGTFHGAGCCARRTSSCGYTAGDLKPGFWKLPRQPSTDGRRSIFRLHQRRCVRAPGPDPLLNSWPPLQPAPQLVMQYFRFGGCCCIQICPAEQFCRRPPAGVAFQEQGAPPSGKQRPEAEGRGGAGLRRLQPRDVL